MASADACEEQLRGMGCTAHQRKYLLQAARFGMGPMAGMPGIRQTSGGSAPSRPRSRSPRGRMLALPPPSYPAPAPAQLAPSAASAPWPRAAEDEDEDIDSFLSGGRANKRPGRAKVLPTAAVGVGREQSSSFQQQTAAAVAAAAAAEAELSVRAWQVEERKKREAEQRRREDQKTEEDGEAKRKDERRHVRQEEKRRRKEEKARKRADNGGEEDDGDDASEDARRLGRAPAVPVVAGAVRDALKGDGAKRIHWGESVKGRVSTDYKGTSDAELARRFAAQGPPPGEKLMTEEEVLALLRGGRKK